MAGAKFGDPLAFYHLGLNPKYPIHPLFAADKLSGEEKVKRYKWFWLAAQNGTTQMELDLLIIETRMSSAEIGRAKKLARAWVRKNVNR